MADGSKVTGGDTGAVDTEATAAGYMPGFGNDFETEALPGALPQSGRTRRSVRPTGSMPSSFPARPSPRRAAPMSAPGSTASARSVQHARRFRKTATARSGKRRPQLGEHDLPHRPVSLGPDADPEGEARPSSTGMRTMTTAGDVNTQTGMAAHVYVVTAVDGGRLFLQRRRRIARSCRSRARLRFFTEFGAHRVSDRARSASSRAA